MVLNQLEKKDYMKTSLQAYSLQNGSDCGNYQDPGYANVLYPTFRKMYKDNDGRLQKALKENIKFFNINIRFLPFTINLRPVILKNKTPSNEIRNIKTALMRPPAGIGDSFAQFYLVSLPATIGTSLTQDGLIMDPTLFFVAMNVTPLAMRLLADMRGHKLDTNIIAALNTRMEQISNIASMMGVAVTSSLVVSSVKISIPIQYVTNIPGDQQEVAAAQEMVDAIAPRLLPVLFTGFIFHLIKVKKRTTYKLVILTIILGAVLSILNLIA